MHNVDSVRTQLFVTHPIDSTALMSHNCWAQSGLVVAKSFHRPSTAWPSYESLYSATARFIDVEYSLTVMGCVNAPDTQRYSRLVDLATLRSDRTVGLSFRDLLAAVRLNVSATVLVVADPRRSFAVPVCDALAVEGGVPPFCEAEVVVFGFGG